MLICEYCNKEFKSQKKYDEHTINQKCLHPCKKTYCSVCEIQYENNKELLRHKLSQYHMDELNSKYDLSQNTINDILGNNKNVNIEIIKEEPNKDIPDQPLKNTKGKQPDIIEEHNEENIVELNEKIEDEQEPNNIKNDTNNNPKYEDNEIENEENCVEENNSIEENNVEENEEIYLSPIIIKLNQISRNKNLDKLMLNFLTQCDILDYQPIYSYIISENTEIDKNIRVRMIKLILHFRKLLIQQLKKGHQNIQNKSIRKIIETLNLLFT